MRLTINGQEIVSTETKFDNLSVPEADPFYWPRLLESARSVKPWEWKPDNYSFFILGRHLCQALADALDAGDGRNCR